MRPARSSVGVLFAAVTAFAGCGEPATAPPDDPASGTLQVHVSTVGSRIDENGYWFRARDTTDFLAPNANVTIARMALGPIEVELGGLANNCAFATDSLLNLEIEASRTALAEFAVTCEAPNVILVAALRRTGPEPDPDGFTVWLDGEDTGSRLVVDGGDTGFSVRPGTHTLELRDVRSNCTVAGENPRRVYVPQETFVAYEVFEVDCADVPGALAVSVSTTGRDPDADGFDLIIDGVNAAALTPNGTVVLEPLPSDSARVGIESVATNCGVLGPAERAVRIPGIDTLRVHFEVVCGAGRALEFTRTERAVLAGDPPDLGAEWTVEFWLRLDAGSGYAPILHQQDVISLYAVHTPPDAVGTIEYWLEFDDGQLGTIGTACDFPVDAWGHVAVTYNHGLLRYYVNGELCRSRNVGSEANAAPGNPLVLGEGPHDTGLAGVHSLDALRIWREARTADELRATRDVAVDPSSTTLLGDWRFDSGMGQQAIDETGRLGDFVLGAEPTVDDLDPQWIAPGRP